MNVYYNYLNTQKQKAENWQWSSLWKRERGDNEEKKLLDEWPIDTPKDYINLVNIAQTKKEIDSLRYSINKGKPYGSEGWANKMIDRFNLRSTLRGGRRDRKIAPDPFFGPLFRVIK